MLDIFKSPTSKKPLIVNIGKRTINDKENTEKYYFSDNVMLFLNEPDPFYEGSYLNRVKYIPKSERWYHVLPLWLINNGYLWNIRQHLAKGSIVLELGCASGVDYFGSRFQMIGLDLSLTSLKHLHNYQYTIQADAANLPIQDGAIDAVISSYFWEHIPASIKDKMLKEFQRVLKPGGKVIFLYDVETKNSLINILKSKDILMYNRLFLEGDGHLGYETPEANKIRFLQHGFSVLKHFGMERTWVQSLSVFEKFSQLPGWIGWIGVVGHIVSKSRFTVIIHTIIVRIIDETIGRLFSIKKSRILISILKKQ